MISSSRNCGLSTFQNNDEIVDHPFFNYQSHVLHVSLVMSMSREEMVVSMKKILVLIHML
jgi:hypothetical protein